MARISPYGADRRRRSAGYGGERIEAFAEAGKLSAARFRA
jgi:hypothetical protein